MAQKRVINVTIVGAGISGIATAIRLTEALGDKVEIKIYERSYDVGGVWRDSTWPGTAVDVPIHLYSLYSHLDAGFKTKWEGRDAVLGYWKRLVAQYRLHDRFIFETEFVSSQWNDSTQQHLVTFRNVETKETFEAVTDVFVAATGALNHEIIPDVEGRETFKGLQWHSSRWNNEVDLRGKKIAIVGNGSSGIQVVPNIVEIEGIQVTNFIRSPGYFRPKINFAYSRFQRFLFKYIPFALRFYRWKIYFDYDRAVLSRGTGTFGSKLRNDTAESILAYMKTQLPQKYWKDLLPNYPMHCKRVAYDAGWLASFARDNVDLVSSPIVGVNERGIVTADGRQHELDYIVWATGFRASTTGLGLNRNVYGENGKELKEIWDENGGAYGYHGITVPQVPNYFAPLGPNAAAMSWGATINHNTALIARYIKAMYDRQLSSIVVKSKALDEFNALLQRRIEKTAWSLPTCGGSWYKNPQGKVVVPAPWSATEMWCRTRKIRWEDWTCRRIVLNSTTGQNSVVTVDIKTPWTLSPVELVKEFVARYFKNWLEKLMIEGSVEEAEEKLIDSVPAVL